MRIGLVIGTVTLNRRHSSLAGCRLKLVVPLSWDNLAGRSEESMGEIAVRLLRSMVRMCSGIKSRR